MANMLYEFIPLLLFFFSFKWYGIYVATKVGIIATILQVLITWLWKKRVDKVQLLALAAFIIFGSMTLYFHNPLFLKWKPTIVFWILACVLLFNHFARSKLFIHRMYERVLEEHNAVPGRVWKVMNINYVLFFTLLGVINIIIAYSFSLETWVNFKVYGILGLCLIFSVLQMIYLTRQVEKNK